MVREISVVHENTAHTVGLLTVDLCSCPSQRGSSNQPRNEGELVGADAGSPLEGASAPPLPGTTEEEHKDGGAGRLRKQNTDAGWCLEAVSVVS